MVRLWGTRTCTPSRVFDHSKGEGKHLPLFIQRTGGTGSKDGKCQKEVMDAELPIRAGWESGEGEGPLLQGLSVTALFLHIPPGNSAEPGLNGR